MKLTKSELIDKAVIFKNSYLEEIAIDKIIQLIEQTEIISDPEPVPEVDTELEEAKRLIGTWVFIRDLRKGMFIVEDVERNRDNNIILTANNNWHYLHEVTPATLPTRAINWRCMKTDVPDTELKDVHVYLDFYNFIGWYDAQRKC